ncbi:MAG: RNA-directed DNA polymerase [Elusimicrobiota bacterium]|jgi:retron-type reverse transcriptase|nr:RNA-directed DNA polymerase [Elusimicrobiota bacterium]
MRRYGNLWDKIISKENFKAAYKKAIKGKSSRKNIIKFQKNAETNLEKVRQLLISKEFKNSRYFEKTIYEPKERIIYILPFNPDRIIQHALMNVISPILDKMFISDSYVCRVGKGIHKGSKRTMEFVRRNKYCLKCDIRKFYPSIDQQIMFDIICRKIKCKDTLRLIETILFSFPGGKNVPIGNLTSQWFGNLYMNELDQYVKTKLKVKDYVRYCDDFCFFHNDKETLKDIAEKVRVFLYEKLKLTFSKCDLFQVKRGVDYLGYRHFNNYILLRKSAVKRLKKRLEKLPRLYEKGLIDIIQYMSSIASALGWAKKANAHNLTTKLGLKELFLKLKKESKNARIESKKIC